MPCWHREHLQHADNTRDEHERNEHPQCLGDARTRVLPACLGKLLIFPAQVFGVSHKNLLYVALCGIPQNCSEPVHPTHQTSGGDDSRGQREEENEGQLHPGACLSQAESNVDHAP